MLTSSIKLDIFLRAASAAAAFSPLNYSLRANQGRKGFVVVGLHRCWARAHEVEQRAGRAAAAAHPLDVNAKANQVAEPAAQMRTLNA
ncbi:MAG TPA: hypothetical protein VM911_16355, partial [Pyrinomonadaceae bacterium]|nr:hypothetical protein [Pyrinomonadaceae bacterium]